MDRSLELRSMVGYGLAETTDLLNRGFSDYVVNIELNLGSLLRMVAYDGIDLASSRVALEGSNALAAALIARRGWSSRLAAMAVVPEARRQGVGKWLVAQLIEEAQARGERRMVLEVIEQNVAAVNLYQNCGFQVVRRLVSYDLSEAETGEAVNLEEIDMRELARMVTLYGLGDLPWQISGESLAQVGPPNRADRLGEAYVAISDPGQPAIGIRALVVKPENRGAGQATRLLRGVMANHPGKRWSVPALCPEEIGELFEKVGFERGSIAQFQMVNEWQ